MNCHICDRPVEIDVDYNYDGSHMVAGPISGKSERCENCCEFVHPECLAPGSTYCRTCEEKFGAVCA